MTQPEIDFHIATDFGGIGFIFSAQCIAEIRLMPHYECPQQNALTTPLDELRKNIQTQLQRYLTNPASLLSLPTLALKGTPFQRGVWEAIRAIPVGQTVSYGQLAKALNSSPRAVSNACGANPFPILTPCHRVVSQSGIGGFMQGRQDDDLEIKRWLLRHEGAVV